MQSLKGKLLVSSGGLYDDDFRHTVVLVGEHGPGGALGVVLNRPLDVAVADAVPALADLAGPGEPVYKGGPVRPEEIVLLAELLHPELADLLVFGSVGFLTGEIPSEIRRGVVRARVFAGYAGWGPGQLEAEMEADSWIVDPAREDDVFGQDAEGLWRRVLERKGPRFELLSRMPFDPSVN